MAVRSWCDARAARLRLLLLPAGGRMGETGLESRGSREGRVWRLRCSASPKSMSR